MSVDNPKGGLIGIAARLAMCGYLDRLGEICENQETVSTAKLARELEKIENRLKDEAVRVRNMANAIN